jgi:GH15 family glucan-1,4-alpha-glucosidase
MVLSTVLNNIKCEKKKAENKIQQALEEFIINTKVPIKDVTITIQNSKKTPPIELDETLITTLQLNFFPFIDNE